MSTLELLPAVVNVKIERGDDASFVLTVKDTTGAAMNFTGCVVVWTIKDAYGFANDSNIPVVQYTWRSGGLSDPQIVVATPASGIAALTLPNTVTATMGTSADFRYRHDVQVADAAGILTTVVKGGVAVKSDATE